MALSFQEIGIILGKPLPESALTTDEWWANTASHTQGAAWLAAGWKVTDAYLRARVIVDGKETTLSTIAAGDFFGEISLLDEGPRSADVLANTDSRLLKISAEAFEKVMREAPALAASFLYMLSKSIGARVRVLTQKYQDSIHFSRAATAVH